MLSRVLLPFISVAICLFTVVPMLPQVWRCCVRGQTAGLAETTVSLYPVTSLTWLTYGLLLGDRVQMSINITMGTLHLCVLAAVWASHRRAGSVAALARRCLMALLAFALLSGVVVCLGLGGLHNSAAVHVVGLAAVCFSQVANVAQPLALARQVHPWMRMPLRSPRNPVSISESNNTASSNADAGDVSGISVARFRLGVFCALLWIVYGILNGQWATTLSSTMALTSSTCVLVYVALITKGQRTAAPLASLIPSPNPLPVHHPSATLQPA